MLSLRNRRSFAQLCLLLCLGLSSAAQANTPKHNAIATAHPLATQAALAMLEQGGNAFDAAVAASAALAVVEPYGSGLGGGGFFLLREAGSEPRYRFLDARERAPLKARAELYQRRGQFIRNRSLNGPLAAAIPGLPAALVQLARDHGRLSLERSLEPAIELARQGFAVDRIYRERAQFRLQALQQDPESAAIFLDQGAVPAEGYRILQPDLADTLETLAEQGHAGFYSGALASQMVETMNKAGGIWSMEDLASYQVVERAPLRVVLAQGRELISAPPPSAGGIAVAQSLLMLQALPWQAADRVQRAHYLIEVMRRAYRDRSLLGDPDHVLNPTQLLLSPEHLAWLGNSIDPDQATPSAALGDSAPWQEGDHTTHFSILDTEGNALAATLSINLPFGAAYTIAGTGLLLNNEMDDFSIDLQGSNHYQLSGSQNNALKPGKRPLSSMTPSFIESPKELAVFGTPGGSRIPSMVLLAMVEYLDQQPTQRWVAAPRFHHQFMPDVVELAPHAFSAEQQQQLRQRGYQLKVLNRDYGSQQVVYWNKHSGHVEAASDPRGIGQSLPATP